MTVRLASPMATRRTTNGLIKGHSRQPVILRRGKQVFTGRVEPQGTRTSSGCTIIIVIRNTSRSDFEPFEKNPVVHRRGFSLPGSRFLVGTRIYRFIFCPNNLRSFASDSWFSGCPIHVPLVFLVFLLLGLASVDVFCQFHQCAAMAADHWPIPPFFGGDFGSQIHYKT